MKGFEAYKCHQAISLHFNKKTNYDYFKYNGNVSVKEENFTKSKNKWQYIGIESKVDQLLWFYYIVYKNNKFSYTTLPMILNHLRKEPIPTKECVFENVKSDLLYLHSRYKHDLLSISETEELYPNIYVLYDKGLIQLETILLFDSYIVKIFKDQNSDDIIGWPIIIKDMELVSPFVVELLREFDFVKSFKEIYLNK